MSTYSIGTEYEKKVLALFESLIASNSVPGVSSLHKVFWQKSYNCDLDRIIKFDVTIEQYLDQERFEKEEWSSIIVIECKKYSSKPDISDFDEFETKLRFLSTYSVKPIFVTPVGFTEMEYRIAAARKIALMRFDGENNWKWEMPRNTKGFKSEEYYSILRGEKSIGSSPLSFYDGGYYNVKDLLSLFGVTFPRSVAPRTQALTKDYFKNCANKLYKEFADSDSDVPGFIISRLFPDFRITFAPLPYGETGRTSIINRVITIGDDIINDTHRIQFTLAHELGHIIFHSHIISYFELNTQEFLDKSSEEWMEKQANWFASYILMPQDRFITECNRIFKSHGLKLGKLVIDNQPGKNFLCRNIFSELQEIFHVSRKALEIRMEGEGLLINNYQAPKRIHRILGGY